MGMNDKIYGECRVRLSYGSLVKLMMLLGFCAGLFAVPLLLLMSLGNSYGLLNVVIGSPIAGIGTGLLLAILGSPVYMWWTARANGQRLSGAFQINSDSALSTEDKHYHS